MYTSSVEIVNLALHFLGVQRISALTDDSKRASLMNDIYTQVRDETLRSAAWGFAMKRAKITKLGTTPAFEFSSQFQLPSDLLKVHSIFDHDPSLGSRNRHPHPMDLPLLDGDDIYYKVEGDKLLASVDTIYLRYISRQTDVSIYPPDFIQCLALSLAAAACFSLTQNRGLRDSLTQEAEFFRRAASANDAQESSPDGFDISSFIRPRY